MKRKHYDVFISYRRNGGAETAKHLRDILTGKGYSVFFDTDSLRNGAFNQELLSVIRECTDFILILSPGALDRCVNEDDWVRKEIACAMENNKNIIPIMNEKFSFPEKLPDDIDNIRWINGIAVHIEYFDAMVAKLLTFMQSVPKQKKLRRWLLPVAAVCVLGAAAAVILLKPGGGGKDAWKQPGTISAALSQEYVEQLCKEGNDAYNKGDYLTALQRYSAAAEQGNALSATQLGYMYSNGLGVQKSYEKAFEYYAAAAEQGDPSAMSNLGFFYSTGRGVEQSDEKALEYYRKAADQGSRTAQFNLGVMYEEGQGVEQSAEKALEYYELAGAQGYAQAYFNIGYMYSNGRGVQESAEKALEYYGKAADLGYGPALYNIGYMYSAGKGVEQSFAKAEEYYRRSAEKGYDKAKSILASWEKNGTPTPVPGTEQAAAGSAAGDGQSKADKYREKAEQGDAVAQFNLGYLYYTGSGVPQSYDKALEYFQMAADQGFTAAQFNLGVMYHNGRGVERDYEKAREYYLLAAEQGYELAWSNLGVLYAKGLGVEQSYEKAAEYYRLAADKGNATAQHNLGMLYYYGRGVEQSFETAVEYIRLAAEQGNTNAMAVLDQWERDGTLTPAP